MPDTTAAQSADSRTRQRRLLPPALLVLVLALAIAIGAGIQAAMLSGLGANVARLSDRETVDLLAAARVDRETSLVVSHLADLALAPTEAARQTNARLLRDYLRLFDTALGGLKTDAATDVRQRLAKAQEAMTTTARQLDELVAQRLAVRAERHQVRARLAHRTRGPEVRAWMGAVLPHLDLALERESSQAFRRDHAEVERMLESPPTDLAGAPAVAPFITDVRQMLTLRELEFGLINAIRVVLDQGQRNAGILRHLGANLAHHSARSLDEASRTINGRLEEARAVALTIAGGALALAATALWAWRSRRSARAS